MLINLFVVASYCRNRAVLIDGSSGWNNYRFESDIWSIYQKLIKRGFDTEDIIIACYDDIANNPNNSYKGQIFNDLDHQQNVYGGTNALKYKNKITSRNIYDMLSNLDTTENDNLFIYYESHGLPGFLFVPNQDEGLVDLKRLLNILIELSAQKKLKKCLVMIEACYSGYISLFFDQQMIDLNLANNIAIITSAAYDQTSVSNKYDQWLGNYISTIFSTNFQEKIQKDQDCTVNELFEYLSSNSRGSTPKYCGSAEIKNMRISDFIGKEKIIPNLQNNGLKSKKSLNLNPNQAKKMLLIGKKEEKTKIDLILEKMIYYINHFKPKQSKKDVREAINDYIDIVNYINKKIGQISETDCDKFLQIYEMSKLEPKEKVIELIDNL